MKRACCEQREIWAKNIPREYECTARRAFHHFSPLVMMLSAHVFSVALIASSSKMISQAKKKLFPDRQLARQLAERRRLRNRKTGFTDRTHSGAKELFSVFSYQGPSISSVFFMP